MEKNSFLINILLRRSKSRRNMVRNKIRSDNSLNIKDLFSSKCCTYFLKFLSKENFSFIRNITRPPHPLFSSCFKNKSDFSAQRQYAVNSVQFWFMPTDTRRPSDDFFPYTINLTCGVLSQFWLYSFHQNL